MQWMRQRIARNIKWNASGHVPVRCFRYKQWDDKNYFERNMPLATLRICLHGCWYHDSNKVLLRFNIIKKSFEIQIIQFLKDSPIQPIDAKEPIDIILIAEPIDPKDKNEPIENPAAILPIHNKQKALPKLTRDAIEKAHI